MTATSPAAKIRLVRELEARMADRDPLPEDFRRVGSRWLIEYSRTVATLRAELEAEGIEVPS